MPKIYMMGVSNNLNFFQKFLIFSGLAIFTLTTSMAIVVPLKVQHNIYKKYVYIFADILTDITSHYLEQEKFDKPFSTKTKTEMDDIISSIIANGELKTIRILNTKGEILYSSYTTSEIKISDTKLKKLLVNEVTFDIIKLKDLDITEIQNGDNSSLMQVYSPISNSDKKIMGYFEINTGFEDLNKDILNTKLYISIVIITCSILFYGLLIGMAKSASGKIGSQTKQLHEDFIETTTMLGELIEIRDHYTGQHVKNIKDISDAVGRKMGLNKSKIEDLKLAASLHDIGKIGISDKILKKRGPLTEQEFEVIKKHPLTGASAIRNIGKLKPIYKTILYHHERYDGKGYPFGLKGKDIPLSSRILSVIDAYDAMTSDRPYRKAKPKSEAISIINDEKGKQFDPEVVNAFISCINKIN